MPNIRLSNLFTYSGDINNIPSTVGLKPTVVEFKTSTTWTVPADVHVIDEILIVAGGGGGGGSATDYVWFGMGYNGSGSGGAGGVARYTNVGVTPNDSIKVVVGAGGTAGTNSSRSATNGGNGGDSSFGDFLQPAIGGGGGGSYYLSNSPNASTGSGGGSGGGGAGRSPAVGGARTLSQGFSGGNPASSYYCPPGAGGGAGGAGENGNEGYGANGGIGILSDISGVRKYYAGGGGAVGNINSGDSAKGFGGYGGGGDSAFGGPLNTIGTVKNLSAEAGLPNSGGGGGGSSTQYLTGSTGGYAYRPGNFAAAGGSGIVIIKYYTV